MGFRLTINGDDCYGKCYGYNHNVHLYSLDYLISINAFKDWGIFDVGDYDEIEDYFCYAGCTYDIILTKEQMKTFMELYEKEIHELYKSWGWDFKGYVLPDCETYTVSWG